jgi:hypothetical protein
MKEMVCLYAEVATKTPLSKLVCFDTLSCACIEGCAYFRVLRFAKSNSACVLLGEPESFLCDFSSKLDHAFRYRCIARSARADVAFLNSYTQLAEGDRLAERTFNSQLRSQSTTQKLIFFG